MLEENATAATPRSQRESQPAESFAQRFYKKNGYLHCSRCDDQLEPSDLPHDCRTEKVR